MCKKALNLANLNKFFAIIKLMGKKQRIKIKLDMLKTLIALFLTALFSVFAYSFAHYKNYDKSDALVLSFCVLLLVFILLILSHSFFKESEKFVKKKRE